MSKVIDYLSLSKLIYWVSKKFYLERKVDEKAIKYLLDILKDEIEFFRYNKLLAALGIMCRNIHDCKHDLLLYRSHRLEKYYEETFKIGLQLEHAGIEYVVIKTYSIFPKDISDIDILVRSKADLFKAEKLLKRMGYIKRKESNEQHLWSIRRNDIVIDIEIHTNIAVSQFEYYPKYEMFKNSVRINDLRVPSPIDDVLLGVSHCVVKDLYITLGDVIQTALAIARYDINPEDLVAKSKRIGVFVPLLFYINILRTFDRNLNIKFDNVVNDKLRSLLSKVRVGELPLRPGLHTVMTSFIDLSIRKMKWKPIRHVMREFMSLPQSKGIDGLIGYLTMSKPRVKELRE